MYYYNPTEANNRSEIIMTTCKIYGMDYALINFVKDKIRENRSVQTRVVFDSAKETFPSFDFDLTSIEDLLYHLQE